MSVTSLLQSAQYRFGTGPDNLRFLDDFYASLNGAQNEFCITRSWGFLRTASTLTTVASTRTVALPSDFGKFYDVPNAVVITLPAANTGTRIDLMPHEEWQSNNYEDGSTSGTPAYSYVLGSSLYLSPIPDTAYTIAILYYKIPANIADSSTAIAIPTVYEECLRKMIFRRLQDSGYSSLAELQVSDADIANLMNKCARDDCRKYGSMTFNLSKDTYTRSTI